MKKLFQVFMFFSLAWTYAQEYAVNKIDPLLSLNVQAVIRENDQKIWLHNYNDMTIENKFVVTVFSRKVVDYLQFYIPYDSYDKVKDYYAVMYDGEGNKVKTFKKRDFTDVSVTRSDLYSDDRAIWLDFTPTFFPFTMEFYYKKNTSSTANIPLFFPYPYSRMSIENTSYSFYNEKEIPIISKKENFEDYDIVVKESPAQYYFTLNNARARVSEELAPTYKEFLPWARFIPKQFQLKGVTAKIEDWDDFANWHKNVLLKGRDELDSGTVAQVTELVLGATNPKEKAKKIYEFMQNRTRYISVQIGIGGWQPFPAKDVDKLGYGDCKGLTNYTKALLKSQGIESYYTLVDSEPDGLDLDEDFVALQGDHVILSVPLEDELVFLECTNQDLPFNFLGTHTDDRKVLMITPEGGVFEKTHTYSPTDNLQNTKVEAVLEENLTLNGQIESKYYGLKYDEIYRLETKDKKEKELYYKSKLSYHNGLTVDGLQFKNDKDSICFTEKINIISPSYTTKAGNRLLLNPNIYNRILDIPKGDSNRVFPLKIRRGYSYKDEITIHLPKDYTVETIFKPFQLSTEFGTYSILVSIEGDRLFYKRELVLLAGEWDKEKYHDYVRFIKEIVKKDNSKIILTKTD